jgi:hypothetical protein
MLKLSPVMSSMAISFQSPVVSADQAMAHAAPSL